MVVARRSVGKPGVPVRLVYVGRARTDDQEAAR